MENTRKPDVVMESGHVKPETLNRDQSKAYDDIMAFVHREGDEAAKEAWLLEGFAGTGKSYLVAELVKGIKARNPGRAVCIAAPTNAAVNVMRANLPGLSVLAKDSPVPGRTQYAPVQFMTIAQLLKLKEVVDEQTGEVSFKPSQDKFPPPVNSCDVVLVDEASMVSSELLAELMKWSEKLRLVFIGDGAQLSPVKEGRSKLFKKAWRSTREIGYSKLGLPMRQRGDSAILDISVAIRDGVWDEPDGVDVPGLRHVTKEKAGEVMREWFLSPEYQEDPMAYRVLCYTNDRVAKVNTWARKQRYPEAGPVPEAGEFLMLTGPVLDDEGFVAFANGDMVKVLKSAPCSVSLAAPGGRHEQFQAGLLEIDGGPQKDTRLVRVLHPSEAVRYADWQGRWKKACKDARNKDLWRMYYDQERTFLKWQYPYASTVHKAQGATMRGVCLIMEDMDKMRDYDPMNWSRLMYVAVTRAKQEVVFVCS